jgi:hypothetical protein
MVYSKNRTYHKPDFIMKIHHFAFIFIAQYHLVSCSPLRTAQTIIKRTPNVASPYETNMGELLLYKRTASPGTDKDKKDGSSSHSSAPPSPHESLHDGGSFSPFLSATPLAKYDQQAEAIKKMAAASVERQRQLARKKSAEAFQMVSRPTTPEQAPPPKTKLKAGMFAGLVAAGSKALGRGKSK